MAPLKQKPKNTPLLKMLKYFPTSDSIKATILKGTYSVLNGMISSHLHILVSEWISKPSHSGLPCPRHIGFLAPSQTYGVHSHLWAFAPAVPPTRPLLKSWLNEGSTRLAYRIRHPSTPLHFNTFSLEHLSSSNMKCYSHIYWVCVFIVYLPSTQTGVWAYFLSLRSSECLE